MCVAQCNTRIGDYRGAKAAYEQVKAIEGGPAHHAKEADERIREIERLRAGLPARDPQASRVQRPQRPAPSVTLHVAVDGDDTNRGTKDSPFTTIERARDEIRALKARGPLSDGGVTVLIGDGEYKVADTFQLTQQDSGTEDAPIVYRAEEGAAPRFNAGRRISGFEPVKDDAILARLPEEARGEVQCADLKGQGITDLGTFEPGGFSSGRGFKTHPLLELYFDNQPMPISRWPNEGYVEIDDVLELDGKEIHGLIGSTKGNFKYGGDRPARWKDEKDAWLYGYWFWDWADSYEKVESIDTDRKEIRLAPPFHTYGYRKGQRFCAVNLLCEIDSPGEWYLDRTNGVLYFYPPSDPSEAVLEIPMLEKPVLELNTVSHVSFEGLLWENGRGDAIIIRNGESCLLAGCTVRKFGGNGVEILGGANHGILSCDIHTLGRGGTVVAGGDRKTLTPGGHFVENCHIHHFSRIDHTYTPAVALTGVGNRIAHCDFHDSGSSAMRVDGNDHIIELNEVHSVLRDSDDQGGSDSFGNPTFRGNVFRYNYWHDMGNGLGCGQAGIRLDDAISGVLIYGNVFVRCADGTFGGVQIHGGKDNIVENNVFVECKAAVSFSPWTTEYWTDFLDKHQKDYTETIDMAQPPHSTRYPELAHLYENNNSNSVWRNVVLNCGEFTLRNSECNDLIDNWVTTGNPGFADLMDGDFSTLQDSQLWNRPSFQPIPFDEIGLYTDGYRRKLPGV